MRIIKAFIIWSIIMLSYKAFSMEERNREAETPLLQQRDHTLGRGIMHQPNPTWYTTVATCYRWCLPCWSFRTQRLITNRQGTEVETQTTPRTTESNSEGSEKQTCCQRFKSYICCQAIE